MRNLFCTQISPRCVWSDYWKYLNHCTFHAPPPLPPAALYPSTVPSKGDHLVEPGWWESCPHGGALVSQDILLLQRFQSSFSLWKKINFPILLQFLKQSSWPGYVERRQSSWKGWRWTRWLFFFKYIFFTWELQVADTCTMILKKFLADPMIPKPKSCLFTSWYSQPYTGGSYTAIGSGGTQVLLLIFHSCPLWCFLLIFLRQS